MFDGAKIVFFSVNKGPKTSTWKQTKKMAFDLNKAGCDVAFIPEPESEKGADAIVKLSHNDYKIVDFKYSTTKLANTLQKNLIDGFSQTSTIVLRIKTWMRVCYQKCLLILEEMKGKKNLGLEKYTF